MAFVGIARSDFSDMFGGAGPSALGIVEDDLLDELGNTCERVLMHDPSQPWAKYTLENTPTIKKSRYTLATVTRL